MNRLAAFKKDAHLVEKPRLKCARPHLFLNVAAAVKAYAALATRQAKPAQPTRISCEITP